MDKYQVLKQYFGYESFRPGQERIIDSILFGKDAFGIMPTGGGKSICYQIPALMMSGVTFVVSPLISLMKDQVMQLKEQGVCAAYINSTLTPKQLTDVYRNLYAGKYKIIYVAPERLETEEFRFAAGNLDISLFAVDEAHCISQWGQDFRPSYLKIPEFIDSLSRRPVVAAFTATATEKVRKDIHESLKLVSPEKVVTSFDRPNLSFDVIRPGNRDRALIQLINERKNKNGIVYCATRKNVETVCKKLCDAKIDATRYHAGLEDDEKTRNQEDFLFDRRSVMVATNAFGMGINKSNVNYVIHYNMPKSLEEYYQEAGRAGRDGESAECILMYSASDIYTAKMLISGGGNDNMTDEERAILYRTSMDRLENMIDYCEADSCYRGKILDYFGEVHPNNCGNCGNCKGKYENKDITVDAVKILYCTKRICDILGFPLGKTTIIAVLRGKKNENITRYSLDERIGKAYGCMNGQKQYEVELLFDFLCSRGYLDVESEHKTVRIAEKSHGVLRKEAPEKVFMPVREKTEAELIPKKKEKKRKGDASTELSDGDIDLFEALRRLRLKIAKEKKKAPFVIFHDSTLRDMANRRPMNADEFMEVSGVGRSKAEKYGRLFLELISEYCNGKQEENTENKAVRQSEKEAPDIEGKKREAAKALDKIWNAPKREPVEDNDVCESGKDTTVNSESGNTASSVGFSSLLFEANRLLSEYGDRVIGDPVKAIVMLTSNGTVYGTVVKGFSRGMSSEETKLIGRMSREYDTRVVKLLTMWQGGNVFGTNAMVLKRLYELERKNTATEILVAKSTSYCYEGEYIPEDYNVKLLKEFL